VEQFLPYLRGAGVTCDIFFLPRGGVPRWRMFRALHGYDTVFLQKRLLRFVDRRILRNAARRLVYDFDDAVIYREDGTSDRLRRRLFVSLVKRSDMVLAGNEFLREQALRYTGRVRLFHTVVDTDRYRPGGVKREGAVIIGWSGSSSTNVYLNGVLPVIARIAAEHPVRLRIVSDTEDGIDRRRYNALPVDFIRWHAGREVADLQGMDIGIMPLPDNRWVRGKCALKALLYMAMGIPAVCSSTGDVRNIISDGRDGFLAGSEEEWYGKLKALVTDAGLRSAVGMAGRRTVEKRYSVACQAPHLLGIFRELCGTGVRS
jgi:glycosyltransferase involved in cell wall biosynthesis